MQSYKLGRGLVFGILFSTPLLAHADFFVSSGDVVERISSSGSVLNSEFASINGATGLTFGLDGNLYVGSPIFSFDSGAGIGIFNGTTGASMGTFVDHVGDNSLNNPQGIVFGNGNFYVADATAGNVFVYNQSGTHINTLNDVLMGTPIGLSLNSSSGTLYIADAGQGNVLSYNGSTFSQVNAQPGQFNSTRDVGIGLDGNLYVLDGSGTGGIYKLSLSDGSAQKIVDYSTSPFFASDLIVGSDGLLYVSGQNEGEGEILRYGTDGSGGDIFADLGFNNSPSFMVESIPEPTLPTLTLLVTGCFAISKLRKRKTGST